jgi:four helix bundle protein
MKTTPKRSNGVMECRSDDGTPVSPAIPRRNRNRGYQQLRVWQDAIELYRLTCQAVKGWPFEAKKIAGQAMSSADSVHRNIAEGYCRRHLKEYIQHLYIAMGSLGESVSGYHAYRGSGQLAADFFETLDSLAFRLENGLLRLVQSLELKRDQGDWEDSLVLRDSNDAYDAAAADTTAVRY